MRSIKVIECLSSATFTGKGALTEDIGKNPFKNNYLQLII